MQATAYTFDPATRSGSVLLDDGTPVPFDAAAFDAGGLRLLRPGQRVRIEVRDDADAGRDSGAGEGSGPYGTRHARRSGALRITLVTLQTF